MANNNEQEFTNISATVNIEPAHPTQSPTPVIHQPTPAQRSVPAQARLTLNKNYLTSIAGILRLALIIFYFAAWVSAASVPKIINGSFYLTDELAATRSAYLFFTIVGFIISVFLFVFALFNLIHFGFLNKLPWIFIALLTDVIWIIPLFVLSVMAAVRETQTRNDEKTFSNIVNYGAFASAAFFGFLCTILVVLDGFFHGLRIMKDGFSSNYP